MTEPDLTPTTPYLIRAIYQWCADQHLTPHLLVDANVAGVVVPVDRIKEGAIVLNLRPSAIKNLDLGNEWILFRARFSGTSMDINVPIKAVRAIFAQENGLGCAFEQAPEMDEQPTSLPTVKKDHLKQQKPAALNVSPALKKGRKKSHLKLVD